MKEFLRRCKELAGFLTLLCILLLPVTANAAETADSAEAAVQVSETTETSEAAALETAGEKNETAGEIGPGIKKQEEASQENTEAAAQAVPSYTQGASLGIFTATAYCPGKGIGKTYSGTTPQAQHTISADLSVLPLGSKVMIDGIVYTVEDKGSSVKGNTVDIFFTTREEALAFGRQKKEVFAVIES